jgi:hypothetical protein
MDLEDLTHIVKRELLLDLFSSDNDPARLLRLLRHYLERAEKLSTLLPIPVPPLAEGEVMHMALESDTVIISSGRPTHD